MSRGKKGRAKRNPQRELELAPHMFLVAFGEGKGGRTWEKAFVTEAEAQAYIDQAILPNMTEGSGEWVELRRQKL